MPRTGNETECAVVDPSQDWYIHNSHEISGLESLCKASCIDVPFGAVITGYSDLREVPLLAKFRTVGRLRVDVEGLKDLTGLENVDITDALELTTHGDDLTSFTSLNGLGDREFTTFKLSTVYGLTDFDGSHFSRLDSFVADGVGLQRLDLSTLTMRSVSVFGAQLTELKLGPGTYTGVALEVVGPLTTFSWQPLTSRYISIQNNTNLSSCVVNQFATESAGLNAVVLTNGNGPCP